MTWWRSRARQLTLAGFKRPQPPPDRPRIENRGPRDGVSRTSNYHSHAWSRADGT